MERERIGTGTQSVTGAMAIFLAEVFASHTRNRR